MGAGSESSDSGTSSSLLAVIGVQLTISLLHLLEGDVKGALAGLLLSVFGGAAVLQAAVVPLILYCAVCAVDFFGDASLMVQRLLNTRIHVKSEQSSFFFVFAVLAPICSAAGIVLSISFYRQLQELNDLESKRLQEEDIEKSAAFGTFDPVFDADDLADGADATSSKETPFFTLFNTALPESPNSEKVPS
mmetsp:Transcript_28461/g.51441  ORF Transcript_28461/g.51441 Transcript_28461/m.51441 type:complete len:191 (+) Transcript_28461:60-632(+)|eukprot:CAMPEP_0197620488 /NCGR_PEP_ID=MMETSP1338-20131121/1312_1 /TAXON_ID=43686 ORGANISM="Pelagodinium beii, Strain RCC1491" /NCGR_SAMPLE_ID=MMETSP1338 /ASSEMBLY_ACC=CAM_ASM_000754 /LENGTH=190 /DNA_ID=CAMNT_0043189693 /DNA_START=61 /DNA_END=633 /DNA_ORIENTATION=+